MTTHRKVLSDIPGYNLTLHDEEHEAPIVKKVPGAKSKIHKANMFTINAYMANVGSPGEEKSSSSKGGNSKNKNFHVKMKDTLDSVRFPIETERNLLSDNSSDQSEKMAVLN